MLIISLQQKTFSIDPVELKKTYKNLMTKLHPDKMNANPSRENIKSDFDASDVTHAYEIISNPLTRASHMLEANGILINEKDSGQDLLGMEFLMQVMEIREIIDGISNSSSAVKDSELIDSKLRPLLEENQQHMKVTIKNLNETFQSNDLEAAKKLTAQLQYWSRIEETIVEKMSRVN